MAQPVVDVSVTNHGSLIGLAMLTSAAEAWAAEHLPDDAPRMGRTIYAEPRYVDAIVEGMQEEGLVVV